jgi:flagellar hook-basal body complex protein FliE
MADPISAVGASGAMMRPDATAFTSAAAGGFGGQAGQIAQSMAPELAQRMLDGAQLADPSSVGSASFIQGGPAPAAGGAMPSFQSILDTIGHADAAQVRSDVLTRAFSQGEDVPIHQVMAAAEEASLALETLTALRNKSLEALNELMRMQV